MATTLSWATTPAVVSSSFSLATDETYLYVAGVNTTNINRISLANPASYTASFISTGYTTGYLISICSDGTYLYTGHGTGYVDRWNKSTGALANISGHFATGSNGLMSIATDGTYLFISSYNLSTYQVALSNPTTTVATYPFFANRPMFSANGYMYVYTGSGDIYQITPSTYAYTKLLTVNANGSNYSTGMVVVGDFMYLGADTTLIKIHLPTKIVTTGWVTGFTSMSLMATDGTYIYTPLFTGNVVSRTTLPSFNSIIGTYIQTAGAQPTFTTINSSLYALTITDISNVNTITFSNNSVPTVVVVGGGGGGGYAKGTFEGAGGGGGGSVIVLTATTFTAGQAYTITVGRGGNGGISASTSATAGSNSVISGNFTITALGGGYGASSTGTANEAAGTGGSGGGANAWYIPLNATKAGGASTATNPYGAGATVYGSAGGAASWGGAGGGGGGATSAGATNTTYPSQGGNGGAGGGAYTLSVNGNTIGNYGGGGGGGGVGSTYTVTLYGAGGGTNSGGAGGNYNTNATAGTANTGGGGGGGGGGNNTLASALNGAGGGSGVVIFVFSTNPCFKLDTKILTNRGYRKIQHLRKGDLVKTFRNGFVPIHAIGTSEINHSADQDAGQRRRGCWLSNRLFRLTTEKYPELFEDLVITGYHSVLVDEFHGIEKTETRGLLGDIYITDGFYRLPACIDRRASIYEESGRHRIYHLALENDNYYGNYGIYANGLLVESCCKRYLLELSNMKLLT